MRPWAKAASVIRDRTVYVTGAPWASTGVIQRKLLPSKVETIPLMRIHTRDALVGSIRAYISFPKGTEVRSSYDSCSWDALLDLSLLLRPFQREVEVGLVCSSAWLPPQAHCAKALGRRRLSAPLSLDSSPRSQAPGSSFDRFVNVLHLVADRCRGGYRSFNTQQTRTSDLQPFDQRTAGKSRGNFCESTRLTNRYGGDSW
jgi:hypothetical protein